MLHCAGHVANTRRIVLYIHTLAVLFLLWAYTPDEQLQALGISYSPSKCVEWGGEGSCLDLQSLACTQVTVTTLCRHWALAVPVWFVLALVYIFWAYEGCDQTGEAIFTSTSSLPCSRALITCRLNMAAVVDASSLYCLKGTRARWPI